MGAAEVKSRPGVEAEEGTRRPAQGDRGLKYSQENAPLSSQTSSPGNLGKNSSLNGKIFLRHDIP